MYTFDDADGNMTGDEDFAYTWDGEYRLVRVEPPAVSLGDHRVRYTYDYQGRRVMRRLDEWQAVGPVTTWVTVEDTRYVYDGWNVVLELDGLSSNAVAKQYTWGLDLSQSLQGAGGVGGLLACRDYVHSQSVSIYLAYLYMYDGNGNVTALVDSAPDSEGGYNGGVLARYDYDPYGNTLSAGGAEATNNPYRFSTKPVCDATGDYYYGYRFYSPDLGRWRSRDLIGERGGANLQLFVNNSPSFKIDRLGLIPRKVQGTAQLFDEDLIYDDLEVHLQSEFIVDCAPSGQVLLKAFSTSIIKSELDSATPGNLSFTPIACNGSQTNDGLLVEWTGGAFEGDAPGVLTLGTGGALAGAGIGVIGGAGGATVGGGIGGVVGGVAGAVSELFDDEIDWKFSLKWRVCCKPCKAWFGNYPRVDFLGGKTLKLQTNSWNFDAQNENSDGDFYAKYESETSLVQEKEREELGYDY